MQKSRLLLHEHPRLLQLQGRSPPPLHEWAPRPLMVLGSNKCGVSTWPPSRPLRHSKPSRPTNGLRPRRSLPAHLISLPAGRDTSAPQSMWPNSRYGSPFFAQPNRQGYPGFAPSLSNVKSGSARPFPTSAFTFTPPLNLPPAPAQASSANATLPLHREPVDILLSPHPPDVSLAAAQGLTSILSAMSVNHGLALEVVIAVYKRAGSLKEADRVLEGMREAAEEWAERALRKMGNHRDSDERADTAKHREMESWYRKEDDAVEDGSTRQSVSRRRSRRESQPGNKRITTELDYVLARPSDETPEYMPPETTRAAKWKRHSTGRTSRSPVGVHQNENPIQSSKDDNDEGECGQVEQMLVNDEEGTLSHVEIHQLSHTDEPPRDRMHKEREEYHDIGALLQTMEPQELEKKLGKDNLRQQIGNLFNANSTHLRAVSHLHYKHPRYWRHHTLNPLHPYLTVSCIFKAHHRAVVA
ncbi:hypothetical protein F5J12DRAFT_43671 [Pisolithus orientalis]|uniref:uncharacterized protein n=1 Tax=Pisolithus orientalis TaxID=936130 RepID=UPI0022257AAF|nr:uncharacterized protein F5J12DRAFT_43671 [Pisolithus orientalis]KAI6009602.1 hypothetical protein F5J12DRAFT_43671 [Pisolithus orientalis]